MNETARQFYEWRMKKVGMSAEDIAKELERVDAFHEARRREAEAARRAEEEARRRETVSRAVEDGVTRAVAATLQAVRRPAVATQKREAPLKLEDFPSWERWRDAVRRRAAASGVVKAAETEKVVEVEKAETIAPPPCEDQQVHDLLLGAGWEHAGTRGDDNEKTHRYHHAEHGEELFVTCGGDGTVRRVRHTDAWGRSRFVAKPNMED